MNRLEQYIIDNVTYEKRENVHCFFDKAATDRDINASRYTYTDQVGFKSWDKKRRMRKKGGKFPERLKKALRALAFPGIIE